MSMTETQTNTNAELMEFIAWHSAKQFLNPLRKRNASLLKRNFNDKIVSARAKIQAMDCLQGNKLYNCYISGIIDLNLYKALQLVYSFMPNINDLRGFENTYSATRHMLLNSVWDNFKLFYRKSNMSLSFTALRNIFRVLIDRIYTNYDEYLTDKARIYWASGSNIVHVA